MSTPLLSAKLVELRQQHGYAQQEVADCLGLTREGYSHYERNAREPSLETLVKLSKLYQIDISELINENTILPSENTITERTATVESRAVEIPRVTNNMNHFLKLFTGKNTAIDLTDISKEDISVLAQYKKLDRQSQKEVRQFIKFKSSISKHK